MKHRLPVLRSENNNVQIPMNRLKSCRSLRHRLKQHHLNPSSSSSSAAAGKLSSAGGNNATATNVTNSSDLSSLSGPQGYVRARKEANETINTNNVTKADKLSVAAAAAASSLLFVRTVDNRPYFPLLKLEDPSNEESILEIATVIVSHRNGNDAKSMNHCSTDTYTSPHRGKGTVVPITGGLTNALYKVDLPTTTLPAQQQPQPQQQEQSYLVRIFGAEGMIDRDEETSNFARLCHHDDQEDDPSSSSSSSSSTSIVHNQLDIVGRFANGRVETWIPNMRPANHIADFGKVGLVLEMARQFARLHYGYTLPTAKASSFATANTNEDANVHTATTTIVPRPTLWNVIYSWIDDFSHKISQEIFQNNDAKVMEAFVRSILPTRECQPLADGTNTPDSRSITSYLSEEVTWLKNRVKMDFPNAEVVFCHNDVNAANVLLHTSIDNNDNDIGDSAYNKQSVCIIDYEYSSMNYAMYDIANFMCEHCGGNDTGCPNYELLPSSERQTMFLREYLREREKVLWERKNKNGSVETYVTIASLVVDEAEVTDLLAQVKLFQMASNLLWGVWGVLQASAEVLVGTFQIDKNGSKTWDNLRYGKNRLGRYKYCKDVFMTHGSPG